MHQTISLTLWILTVLTEEMKTKTMEVGGMIPELVIWSLVFIQNQSLVFILKKNFIVHILRIWVKMLNSEANLCNDVTH